MKKIIYGIALVSQFAFGVSEEQGLLNRANEEKVNRYMINCFDESKERFNTQIKQTALLVNEGFNEIASIPRLSKSERSELRLACLRREFRLLRNVSSLELNRIGDQINEVFLRCVASHSEDMQKVIAEREKEVQILRAKVNGLIDLLETKENSDLEIICAEEFLKSIQDEIKNIEVPELFRKNRLNEIQNNSDKMFDKVLADIEDDSENLMDIGTEAKEIFDEGVENIRSNVRRKLRRVFIEVEKNTSEIQERLKYAYDKLIEVLKEKIEKYTKHNLNEEKKAELINNIQGIYADNSEDKFIKSRAFILDDAVKVMEIQDFFERRKKTEDLYNKVKLFERLFDREDLGVKAKRSDLEEVKMWLDRTHIDVIVEYFGLSFSVGEACCFDGKILGKPLFDKKLTIENKFKSWGGVRKHFALDKLAFIFQKNEADTVVKMEWGHPLFWGTHYTDEILYLKNGDLIGRAFQERTGGYWGESQGIFGNVAGGKWLNLDIGYLWNTCCWNENGQFKRDLRATSEAIKRRAGLLYDFVSNENSLFQSYCEETETDNPLILRFPKKELSTLIDQCNDFIVMIS